MKPYNEFLKERTNKTNTINERVSIKDLIDILDEFNSSLKKDLKLKNQIDLLIGSLIDKL